jgi:hypothetical protein
MGATDPAPLVPSLEYQRPATALTMNFIGLGWADALGYDYSSFRKANYTTNEADYCMFHQVRAMSLTGLIEVGELTCEKSERELITSSHAVGANVASAIDFIIRTPEVAILYTLGKVDSERSRSCHSERSRARLRLERNCYECMVRRATAREKFGREDKSAQMYSAFGWRVVLLARISCARVCPSKLVGR